jgi:hypothetical protein
VKNVVTNSDNNSTQLHEASSSNFIKNSQSVYSDPKQTINDLLLKIPQLLLQQGLSSVTVSIFLLILCSINNMRKSLL